MQQRNANRLSSIVRAAAVEVACPEPPPPPPPTPLLIQPSKDALAAAEAREAQALRDLLAALGHQVQELRGRRQQSIGEIARLSVELAAVLAEDLVKTEIGADRQRLDRIVRGALERVPTVKAVTVRGHPDDIALLEKQLANHEDLQACGEMLTLRPDGAVARGRLTLEASEFFVEWDTASCLTELRGALLEATHTDG